jgi:predicted exporter
MDEAARGIATAALTLQSVLLQGLIANGTMTPGQALEAVDRALAATIGSAKSRAEKAVALVTAEALQCGWGSATW